MTRFQYQSSPPIPVSPTVETTTGGFIGPAKTGTWYFWLVVRTRGGYTQFSAAVSITVNENNVVQITIPSAIRTEGSDVRNIYIIGSESSDPLEGAILGGYPGYESNGSLTSLPTTIEFSRDEHLELAKTVAVAASLPSGSNLVNRMRRYVEETNSFKEYILENASWQTVFPGTFNPYLVDTTGLYGADREARNIDLSDVIVEGYDLTDESKEINYVVYNDGSITIPTGKRIGIAIAINSVEVSSAMSNRIFIRPKGIVRLSDGSLDISGQDSVGTTLAYQGYKAIATIEKAIPPGYGYLFGLLLLFDLDTFKPEEKPIQGSSVSVYAGISPVNGEYAPDGGLIGDFVRDGRYILPNGPFLMPIATGGTSRVGKFITEDLPPQDVPGLELNTDNQQLAITNNGTIYKASTIPGNAALRAIASTVNGVGQIVGPTQLSLTGGKAISISLTNPSAVRSDYPDIVAEMPAILNAGAIYIYVQPTAGGTITRFLSIILGNTESPEVFVVGTVAGTNIGTNLPTVANDMGLFIPEVTITTTNTTSVFSTGTYNVWVGYYFEDTLSKITHDSSFGCIYDLSGGSVATTIYNSRYWRSEITSASLARDLSAGELAVRHYRIIAKKLYLYLPEGTGFSDDGIRYIVPTLGGVFIAEGLIFTVADLNALRNLDVATIADFEYRIVESSFTPYLHTKSMVEEDDGDRYIVSATGAGTLGWIKAGGSGGGTGTGITVVDSLAALKAVTGQANNATYLLKANSVSGLSNIIYRYDSSSTTTGDDIYSILPTTGGGRWLITGQLKRSNLPSETNYNFVTETQLIAIGNLPLNTASELATKLAKPSGLPSAGTVKIVQIDSNGIPSYISVPANSYATASISITVPNTAQTRSITVTTGVTDWISVNQVLLFSDGTNSAYLKVTAITSSVTFTVTGLDGRGNTNGQILNSGPVANGLKFVTGDRGVDGTAPIAKSSAVFAVPDPGETANLVLTSTTASALFPIGLGVTVTDGTLTAWFIVNDIPSPGTLTLYRESSVTNPSGTLNAGATTDGITIVSGYRGTTGGTGLTGDNGSGYGGTSTTSNTIGTGSLTFTTQSGLAYQSDNRVRIANSGSNYVEGTVTSYSSTTLIISADRTVGSGTYASWTIGLTGDVGPTGSVSTAGGIILDSSAAPVTSSTQRAVYYDGIDIVIREENSGITDPIITEKDIINLVIFMN